MLRTIPPAHLVHVDSGRYWILNMRSRYSIGLSVIDWPQSGNSFWTCVAMQTCTSCACMLVRVDNGRYWVLDIHLYSTGLNAFWKCMAMQTHTSRACTFAHVDNGRYCVLGMCIRYSIDPLAVTIFGTCMAMENTHPVSTFWLL